jgi:hypothetical protein
MFDVMPFALFQPDLKIETSSLIFGRVWLVPQPVPEFVAGSTVGRLGLEFTLAKFSRAKNERNRVLQGLA